MGLGVFPPGWRFNFWVVLPPERLVLENYPPLVLASLSGDPRPGSGGHPEVAYGIFTAVTRPPLRTDGHAFHHLAFRRIAQSAPLTPTQRANRGPVLSVAPTPKPKMEIEDKHRKMLPSPPAPPRPAPSAVARMWNLQPPPTLGTPGGGSSKKKNKKRGVGQGPRQSQGPRAYLPASSP